MKVIRAASVLSLILIFVFSPINFSFFVSVSPASAVDLMIEEDTEWSGLQTISGYVTIVNGATLTIKHGAIIEFEGRSGITVEGNLRVNGTPSDPVLFRKRNTANVDDVYSIDGFGNIYARNIDVSGGGSAFETFLIGREKRDTFIQHAEAMWLYRGAFTVRDTGTLDIEGANFHNNALAVYLNRNNGFGINFHQSNFVSNDIDVVSAVQYGNLDMSNNWWDDANGPIACTLDCGDYYPRPYQKIIGTINFIPWLDHFASSSSDVCTENCFSNVMFLPGIESSRLYAKDDPGCLLVNCENQLWEPNRNDDVHKLYLDTNGKSTNLFDVYTKENAVIDELDVTGSNIYKSFIDTMNKLKDVDHLINDWKATPYDWRLSYDDIVKNGTSTDDGSISYNHSSPSPYIVTELHRLAESSRTGKVTIIAHSNGGLVAKKMMETLGDEETAKLIDRVIFVAVPQVGTPMSIPAMLNGFDQDHVAGLITSQKTARGLAEYMPGVYQLLPSEKYFTMVTTPVVTFDPVKLPDWAATYGENISSFDTLQTFLTDTANRVSADDSDIETPSTLHQNLLDQAGGEHQTLDEWRVPAGVEVIEIAGWGVPATVDGVHYDTEKGYACDKGSGLCSTSADVMRATPHFTLDGDGTVVTPSALWMNSGDGAVRYWFDLAKYNSFLNKIRGGRILNSEHSDILEPQQINNFIVDTVTHTVKPLSDYTYLSTEVPLSTDKRLEYVLHSPLTLDLYDDEGHHTGVSPTTGQVEEQIPGTYYRQFGEVKYIFSDESIPTHLTLDGYDTGRFTLEVKELQGDIVLGQMTFQDMPTTDTTKVSLDIPTDLSSASPLRIDRESDGTDDFVIASQVGDPVVFDATPPVTDISLVGTVGMNDWYASDVTVTFTAQDSETGVDHISYSLDEGVTWNIYASPLVVTAEGITTVRYFSTNTQGSGESIQTKTIKIDKTAPEARVTFNSVTQKLEVIGIDNLSAVSMTAEGSLSQMYEKKSEKRDKKRNQSNMKKNDEEGRQGENGRTRVMTTLRNEAGHTTVLVFLKEKDKEDRIDLKWQSIVYDGVVFLLSDTKMQYQWRLSLPTIYEAFSAYMRVDQSSLRLRYLPKRNETWILDKPRERDDDEEREDEENEKQSVKEKVSGMIIPSMTTEKGIIKINY